MPSYRFPVLVWQHFSGAYTACLVADDRDVAAVSETRSGAVGQIKDLLQWRYRQRPWLAKPDFIDPELVWQKVEIRPEYQVERRLTPCREPIVFRVPCVQGKDNSGLLQCALPTLGIRFNYDEPKSLAGLVSHYVQAVLKGSTPQDVARCMPPPHAELEDVVVLVPKDPPERQSPPNLEVLASVAEPMGFRAARTGLSRPWQREAQVAGVAQALSKQQSSILLLGESGSGKTAVLMEAVRKAERTPAAAQSPSHEADEKSTAPAKHRFWLTNASRLISGMQYLGQWQQRVEAIIAELSEIEGVLCVENLLDLVRTGGVGPNDSIAAFLIPYLQRAELRLVGESTPAELDACRRMLPAFASLFQIVEIPELTPAQAIAALDQLGATHRQNLRVAYEDLLIKQIYRLFSRFMPYQSFPGRAASFTAELFDRAAPAKSSSLTPDMALERFVRQTGLPELFLRDELPLRFEDVVNELRASVIGQERACRAVAGFVTAFKAGINDPNRPLGVLLFCGPTGVGKTELARTVSQFLFGHGQEKDRLIRLDMSEYSGPGAAERLVGPPEGEPSDLIKRIRQQPFAVLLLDEIEKAAPEVFDVLLGVFDEGRLTDRYGRLSTFRSALIIMTSNLGAEQMTPFGLSRQATTTYDIEATAFFRPEFFNRIDAVVTFDALSEETIAQIVIGELQRLSRREGLSRNEIRLQWTGRLVKLLTDRGYDPRFGVRPLQRAIETLLVAPLAKYLIAHPAMRNTFLLADVDDVGQVTFSAA